MRVSPKIAAAAAALLAAGCGSVENPDLATGTVTGRLSGASAGAYAYVLGTPAVHAPIATDGSFRLDGVPAGSRTIVVFDGGDGAKAVEAKVEGASITDLPAEGPLPLACAILVAAGLGGAKPTGLAFSVGGTLLRAADRTQVLSVPGPAAVLFPIPEGYWDWTLRAGQPGYQESMRVVSNLWGGESWPVDVSLDVESTGDQRGCVSSGCESSPAYALACDTSDGHCYECAVSTDCTGGATCSDHVCVPSQTPSPGSVKMCEACTGDADCVNGFAYAGVCVKATATAPAGYCSYDCSSGAGGSAGACPSGYKCGGVPTGVATACLAPESCLALYTTYGSSCATDSACSAALDGGMCWRPAGVPTSMAGVCSAPCTADADCPASLGLGKCDPSGSGYCRAP